MRIERIAQTYVQQAYVDEVSRVYQDDKLVGWIGNPKADGMADFFLRGYWKEVERWKPISELSCLSIRSHY